MSFFYPAILPIRAAKIFVFVSIATTAAAQDTTGVATVIDGDTIKINGQSFRLSGIDAPEIAQTCDKDGQTWHAGKASKAWLKSYLRGATVHCNDEGRDKYNRIISTCFKNGRDINAAIIRKGWAQANTFYTTRYEHAEATAKQHQRGIWAAKCQSPAQWRARNK